MAKRKNAKAKPHVGGGVKMPKHVAKTMSTYEGKAAVHSARGGKKRGK